MKRNSDKTPNAKTRLPENEEKKAVLDAGRGNLTDNKLKLNAVIDIMVQAGNKARAHKGSSRAFIILKKAGLFSILNNLGLVVFLILLVAIALAFLVENQYFAIGVEIISGLYIIGLFITARLLLGKRFANYKEILGLSINLLKAKANQPELTADDQDDIYEILEVLMPKIMGETIINASSEYDAHLSKTRDNLEETINAAFDCINRSVFNKKVVILNDLIKFIESLPTFKNPKNDITPFSNLINKKLQHFQLLKKQFNLPAQTTILDKLSKIRESRIIKAVVEFFQKKYVNLGAFILGLVIFLFSIDAFFTHWITNLSDPTYNFLLFITSLLLMFPSLSKPILQIIPWVKL